MFKKNNITSVLVFLVIAGAYLFFGEGDLGTLLGGSEQTASVSVADDLRVQNVRIYDLDGRVAYEGTVDLRPELERINRGERDPHDNDGATFGNREGLLPQQPRGYYREYVVRTPGISHAGPQRIVLGEGGEAYYTPDHYDSFVRIN